MSKRVLVTGGAGFIGSHLCERLLTEGAEVTALDDLSTGSIENLHGIKDNSRFSFVQGSVCDVELVDRLAKESDDIYHLAAAVGVQLIVDEPVRTIETNIHGSENVLHAAARNEARVLIASTSEVYGKSENVPFREDDDMLLGSTRFSRWSYACSKAVDEFLAFAFYQKYGLEVIVARFFNTIGPRQRGRYGMVVPRFVKAALNNEPVTIYGSGKQTRCFTYISDVIDGVIALMQCPDAAGEAFNIGSQSEISIESLADAAIRLSKSSSEKKYISYEQAYGRPFDDMMRRVPSIEKAAAMIGYSPKVSLEEAIVKVINYYKTVS
ncbi:dTDP-glucose 4,6-dehydratase [Limihaloglobus sulfuriphilus]|uniref:UDP-glucuronate decarboxylase n=1 Tax=Limihaloglobus sulfuriphilus TaxID=1851148 RepID=A0A1Q2ME13_9BACT|nr:SDR family NAD(P)-dependent oxidoreductase [Limihaloglobus sulfuriphilus]AQQ70884.1 dTDP-glucose 4,6-dehydratase [Limihaloglobus sulfuriphilus]